MRPGRLVEVVVERADGIHRGSGYRVTSSTVLTARHVVEGASRIEVRFDAGLPTAARTTVEITNVDSESDLALLSCPNMDPVEPAPLGRVNAAAAVLDVHVAGFPRWKVRGGRFRESATEPGTAALLANRREGTLQINVAPPAVDPEQGRSPWEGMSGGPVFVGDRLIAVVTQHHWREGLNRLTAIPLVTWLDRIIGTERAEVLGGMGLKQDESLGNVAVTSISAYHAQVRDIAPENLIGRAFEIDTLTGFCASDEAYVWWQASPWAGKTALMSSFVLAPPAGVQVVSFFVTGRLAGQSDSTAFTEALVDQLGKLLSRELPPSTGPGARDALRRQLLADAASRAAALGQRVVLVVDGLDEDAGTSPGSEVPSIASLLPPRPSPGLKVIVSGRPHPPIPTDVPADHPLRHCQVVELKPSPHAKGIARDATRELGRHLASDGVLRDLVGLLTASGGGLALDDLAALINLPRYTIDDFLNGVFGRTVERREDAFLFAHDALRRMAVERLGSTELARYRDRIHTWADSYRARGWPVETPDYLLRGYFGLLRETRDLPRMVANGTDHARHDCMLSRLHADTAALADIEVAQRTLLTESEPDLVSIGRLAVHRDFLVHRNLTISPDIPELWAQLGLMDRAVTLAESITDPGRREAALRILLTQAISSRDWERVFGLLRRNPDGAERTKATIAAIVAQDAPVQALLDQELELLAELPDAQDRTSSAVGLATALVVNGDRMHLEYLFHRLDSLAQQIEVVLRVATECENRGIDITALIDLADSLAKAAPTDEDKRSALNRISRLQRARLEQPSDFGSYVQALPRGSWESGSRKRRATSASPSLEAQLTAAIKESLWSKAATVISSYREDEEKGKAWLRVAEAQWDSGCHDDSRGSLDRAAGGGKRYFRATELPLSRIAALAEVQGGFRRLTEISQKFDKENEFKLLCAAIRHSSVLSNAEVLQCAIELVTSHRWLQLSEFLGELVSAASGGGSVDLLFRLVEQQAPHSIINLLVGEFLKVGAPDHARALADKIPRPAERAAALVSVARALAESGDNATAKDAAEEAELAARSIPDLAWQREVLTELAGLASVAGDAAITAALIEAVERLANQAKPFEPILDLIVEAVRNDHSLLGILGNIALVAGQASDDPDTHGELVARLARVLAAEGRTDDACLLLVIAERLIAVIPVPARRDWALADLVWAASAVRDFLVAERAVSTIDSPDRRAELQVHVVSAMAAAGDVRRAGSAASRIAVPGKRAEASLEIVRALTRRGELDQAAAAANSISSPELRSEGLLLIVQTAARWGELHRAADVAILIPNDIYRRWAFECVDSTTRASVETRGSHVVSQLPQHDLVPEGTWRLFCGLSYSAHEAAHVRSAAAEAFVAGDSRTPLATLVRAYPEVIRAIATETLALAAIGTPSERHGPY
ncbi:trypsin-like peptidase domain-containing protein [Micromonospora parva]|uniref:trypsin-like peptidase domain-containing protein n=1 Tax=Micromonospora parva TaxID=1464048 RepID=UPI0033F7A9AF